MSAATDITIVTVSYNSSGVLPGLLASRPENTAVVIVDNGSTDIERTASIASENPSVTLLRNSENLGFGAACNRGASQVKTDFILFLNPDSVLEAGALEALLSAAQGAPEAAAFNPGIFDGKGRQRFRGRSPLLARSEWTRDPPEEDAGEIPVLAGSAIFLRRQVFEEVGGFDEAIFLYHEDDDLSLRLRRIGPLMLVPAAKVTHLAGRSSARSSEIAAIKGFHMGRSRVYAMTKHGRPVPWFRTLLRALLQVLSPEMIVSRRKRAKYGNFLRGAWSARLDGGRFVPPAIAEEETVSLP